MKKHNKTRVMQFTLAPLTLSALVGAAQGQDVVPGRAPSPLEPRQTWEQVDPRVQVGADVEPIVGDGARDYAQYVAKSAEEVRVSVRQNLSRLAGLNRVDGRLIGGGPAYQVEFSERGFELVPALGPDAERAESLSFELESIRREGALLYSATETGVSPLEQGLVVDYALDAEIVERYEVLPEGVEQSYTFASLPAGTGDLVVRGRLDTELVGSPLGETDGGLWFGIQDFGGIAFGGVTGIDANGASTNGFVRYDGVHVELVLPGDFVDGAAYPMVLDPLIGPEITVPDSISFDDVNADVSYNATDDVYLVAWQRDFSLNSVGIRAARYNSSGALLGGGFITVDATQPNTKLGTAVANIELHDRFLIVWAQAPGPLGPYDIIGRSLDSDTGFVSPPVSIAATSANERFPDVGGEQGDIDDEALVVWDDGTGIEGTLVTVPAAGTPTVQSPFTVSTNPEDTKPAISRHGAAPGRWLIVWQRFFPTALFNLPDHDIYGRVVADTGVMQTAETFLTGGVSSDEEDPDCANLDGASFCVAWEVEAVMDDGDNDIYCMSVDFNGASLTTGTPVLVAGNVGVDEADPAIDYAQLKSIVVWSREVSGFDRDIYSVSLNNNCKVCESTYVVEAASTRDARPQIAAQFSSSASSGDQAMAVWQAGNAAVPFDSAVRGTFVEAVGAGGGFIEMFPSCGFGGICSLSSPAATGNSDFGVRLDFADPAATTAILAFNVSDSFFFCGPCTWLVWPVQQGLVHFVPAVGGSAEFKVPFPCSVPVIGAGVNCQWMTTPTGVAQCFVFPTEGFSNIIKFFVGV